MNESSATAAVHNKLPTRRMRVWKIADRFTNGIPDAYYGGNGGQSLWVEYKLTKRKTPPPVIDITPENKSKIKLSDLQQAWLNSHHDMGHNVAAVLIHYRPRNASYYILLDGQWNTPQRASDLLHLDQKAYVSWILSQTGTNDGALNDKTSAR